VDVVRKVFMMDVRERRGVEIILLKKRTCLFASLFIFFLLPLFVAVAIAAISSN